MARTPAQRGATGNWLVLSRVARGWDTQERARAEIERLAGWRIPQSVYAEWESGRRIPSDANLARLREFYGPTTDLERPESPDALAAAIRGLTDELRAWRAEDRARLDDLEAAVGRLVEERLTAGERAGSPAPSVPRG